MKNVVIATHYMVYGAPQALREYFIIQKIPYLLFIAHPLKLDGSRSFVEKIVKGKQLNQSELPLRTGVGVINYFLDIFFSFLWTLIDPHHFSLYIGVDPLNALAGLVLKKLGKVDKVIFYTIDFSPMRFENKWLNDLYHGLDKFCLTHADETWNVSDRIAEGREKVRGLKRTTYTTQKIVPIGIWYDRVKRMPFAQIKKHQLLFVGNLLEKQGVQLVLDAMPAIIKQIPDFHFMIVGGGEYEDVLRKKVKQMKLDTHVTFTGWIRDREELDTMMADSAIAIAMYDKKLDTFTYYADPTKLKDYLSAGLPILLTDVPHNAEEIEKAGCGTIINYDKDEIAQQVIRLMKDSQDLKRSRENALKYIKKFEWSTIFDKALSSSV